MEIYVILSILIVLLGVQTFGVKKGKDFSKFFSYTFVSLVIFVFVYYILLSYLQIEAWQSAGPPAKYLAPPYESALYAFGYHFQRIGIYYLLSLIVAIIFLSWSRRLNNKSGELFFEKEEPYLGAISIFLLGVTSLKFGWIYYLLGIILIPLVVNSYKFILKRKDSKFSLRLVWLPVAIVVLISIIF